MMTVQKKYEFSFTASSLRLQELVKIAEHRLDNKNVDGVNVLGYGKSSTGKRLLRELNKRLNTLTQKQLELLVNGDLTIQKQIAFLSICKRYAFIRDFVIDVLREKYLVYDYQVTEGEYISFYRNKEELHPEMDDLTESTKGKVRQITFKMLEQVGILNNIEDREIQYQILDDKVIDVIVEDNWAWLKIFLISDIDATTFKNSKK